MKLSREKFELAENFIHENARNLDRHLFEYWFNNGEKEQVVDALSKYQNEDGGFGHGIEPDLRLSKSSPMATSVGLQYCIELGVSDKSTVVRKAVAYLVSTYDREHGYWPFTSMEVNDEPHAPWWTLKEVAPPEERDWANPSAELFGYMHRFSNLVPEDFLHAVTQRAQQNLDVLDVFDGLYYNLMSWERIYRYLPKPMESQVKEKIKLTFKHRIDRIEEELGEIRVFWIAPKPTSQLASYSDVLHRLHRSEIDSQAKDGGWWPTWRWGMYEDVWPIAEREWAGKMTTECLHSLRAFNLIE